MIRVQVALAFFIEAWQRQLWRSQLFTFAPSLNCKQTWDSIYASETDIYHTWCRRFASWRFTGLQKWNEEWPRVCRQRLGELNIDDQITASFVLRATDTEMTNTYRYVMTVPGVLTSIGGTLAPWTVYCLWKKCRGGSVLDTENELDRTMIDQALDRHLVVEPEQDTRKADEI